MAANAMDQAKARLMGAVDRMSARIMALEKENDGFRFKAPDNPSRIAELEDTVKVLHERIAELEKDRNAIADHNSRLMAEKQSDQLYINDLLGQKAKLERELRDSREILRGYEPKTDG